ncbi:aspartyl protease domain-containing protein [Phthorimaea operculella]|nr:aspartyl protease domain-containing protein [Phthorimaea operculella]
MSVPAPKPKLRKRDLLELAESRDLPTVNPVTNKLYTVKQLKNALLNYLLSELDPVDQNTAANQLLTSVNSVESEVESDDEASQPDKENSEDSSDVEASHIVDPVQTENMPPKQENSSASGQESVYNIVKNWDISFDTFNDPVEFLESLDEYATSCEVPKEKLLPVLTRFLKGKANLWHRNNRDDWSTWDEFIKDFKRYFYPRGYETNLIERIIARKQGCREKFVDYLTDLQTIMRRYGKLKSQEKLERIYENMNANYKLYVQRQDFDSVHDLIELCTEYEKITEEKYRNWQPRMFENDLAANPFESSRPDTRHDAGPSRPPNSSYGRRAEAKNSKPMGGRDPKYLRNYNSKTSCFSCGGENHRYTECTGRKQIFCSTCGKIGVLSRNCCKSPTERVFTVGNPTDKENRVFIPVTICGKHYQALLDSGSTSSSVSQEVYDELSLRSSVQQKQGTDKFVLANNTLVSVTSSVFPTMDILGSRFNHQMYLLPDSDVVIVGMDLMRKIGLHKIWKYIEETEIPNVEAPESNVRATHTKRLFPPDEHVVDDQPVYQPTLPPGSSEPPTGVFQNGEDPSEASEVRQPSVNKKTIKRRHRRRLQKLNNRTPDTTEVKVPKNTTENQTQSVCTARLVVVKPNWYEKKITEVQENPKEYPDYHVKDGRLRRKIVSASYRTKMKEEAQWKICIPPSETNAIIQYHFNNTSLTASKLLQIIAKNHYWPGMYRDVSKYVNKRKHSDIRSPPIDIPHL